MKKQPYIILSTKTPQIVGPFIDDMHGSAHEAVESLSEIPERMS